MLTEPVGQLAAIEPACGEIEHKAFLGIEGGIDLGAVEDQEGFHGGMPHAFVAIDERVILNQRQAQRRALLNEGGIQVNTIEGDLRLRNGGFQPTKVADARCAAGRLEEAPMQLNNLTQRDIPNQARRR